MFCLNEVWHRSPCCCAPQVPNCSAPGTLSTSAPIASRGHYALKHCAQHVLVNSEFGGLCLAPSAIGLPVCATYYSRISRHRALAGECLAAASGCLNRFGSVHVECRSGSMLVTQHISAITSVLDGAPRTIIQPTAQKPVLRARVHTATAYAQ